MEKNSPTRSVDRALEILDCFIDQEEMILLELAEKTGLSPSTALRILNALQSYDYVIKDSQTKKYRLGRQIRVLADHAREDDYTVLRQVALPYMIRMNERYNEDVRLFVPAGRYKLCVESVDSRRELRQVLPVGSRMDLVRGAAGKIILAYMPKSDRQRLFSDHSLMDDNYEMIRLEGYAISRGEREEGLFGLAIPITDSHDKLLATISLSGPSVRFENDGLDDKIEAMRNMGQHISEEYRKIGITQRRCPPPL